ncbi:MAG: response regulator transcription factor [Methyloligellaceae bacterium]
MKRILIVDDHPLFREALQLTIARVLPKTELHEAPNIDEALKLIRSVGRFDLALLDLFIPNVRGFDGLLSLRTQYPKLPVVVVTGQEDQRFIREAMNYGAAGFIPKSYSKEKIVDALLEIYDGNVHVPDRFDEPPTDSKEREREQLARRLTSLTRQQLVVLRMIRGGKLNKQIAFDLGLSETTIKSHVSEILRKLNVVSRTQAAMEAGKIDFDTIKSELSLTER